MVDFLIEPVSPGSNPTEHYDSVVNAWGNLLGENLHYGYFESAEISLADATEALTTKMLHAANFQADMVIADIGCGTGRAACRIAQEFAATVTGISPSKKCVEQARLLAEELGVSNSTTFAIGDGTKMAFENSSFDRVLVMESSHLMSNKKALLQECARVLRPGGKVVLCDIVLKRKLPIEKVIEYRDEFLLLRDVFGRATMEPLDFYSSELKSNGLHIEVEHDISEQTFPTFQHWRKNAQDNRSKVIAELTEKGWKQFLISCGVLEKLWKEDILGYGIVSAST